MTFKPRTVKAIWNAFSSAIHSAKSHSNLTHRLCFPFLLVSDLIVSVLKFPSNLSLSPATSPSFPWSFSVALQLSSPCPIPKFTHREAKWRISLHSGLFPNRYWTTKIFLKSNPQQYFCLLELESRDLRGGTKRRKKLQIPCYLKFHPFLSLPLLLIKYFPHRRVSPGLVPSPFYLLLSTFKTPKL